MDGPFSCNRYCLNRYKTQQGCDEAVDACLSLLKFVPDWFVTSMMLKDLDNAVFFNDDIVFVNAYLNVRFFADDTGLVDVDLNNVSLDDDGDSDNDNANPR